MAHKYLFLLIFRRKYLYYYENLSPNNWYFYFCRFLLLRPWLNTFWSTSSSSFSLFYLCINNPPTHHHSQHECKGPRMAPCASVYTRLHKFFPKVGVLQIRIYLDSTLISTSYIGGLTSRVCWLRHNTGFPKFHTKFLPEIQRFWAV